MSVASGSELLLEDGRSLVTPADPPALHAPLQAAVAPAG